MLNEQENLKILRALEDSLPYPIAVGLKLYRDIHPDRHSDRADALLKVFEALVKFIAAVAAKSCLLDGKPSDAFSATLQSFRKPSLGHWVGILRGALGASHQGVTSELMREIGAWFESPVQDSGQTRKLFDELCQCVPIHSQSGKISNAKIIDLLVSFRNKGAGHGARVTNDEYRSRHAFLQGLIQVLLSGLKFLEQYPMAFVEEVRVRGGEYFQMLRIGRGKEFELREVKSEEPLQDMRVYCFQFDALGMPAFALDLSPFILFQACSVCKTEQLFFFNGHAKSMEYLSYQCGHFLTVSDPSGELANIEKFLSGEISLYALFHGKMLGRKLEPGPIGASREDRAKAGQLIDVVKGMLRKGQFNEALPLMEEALAMNPDSSEAHLVLGIIKIAIGKEKEAALADLSRATELNPDSAPAQYALGRVSLMNGGRSVAEEAFRRAHSLDPANQRYAAALEDVLRHVETVPGDENGIAESACSGTLLANDLLDEGRTSFPEIRWWITALPPWSWIRKRPFLGSLGVSTLGLLTVFIFNLHGLNARKALWFLNIALLQFMGLYSPFLIPKFLKQVFLQLRAVVSLPPDTFQRWFLAEIVPFAGSSHLFQDREPYTAKTMYKRDRFHLWVFIAGFISFFPLQTACAQGLDPFKVNLPTLIRYVHYYFEMYALAWIPTFVLRGLQFIPGFKDLPLRHFVDMPSSVSLKPLGKFFLKVASLGSVAYLLFTLQHYLFRTHVTVPLVSMGFILVVYSLFFAVMFLSQGAIMAAMVKLKERRMIEYSRHLERAFIESMRNPSEASFLELNRHREYMKSLRSGLDISGFTFPTLVWFLALTVLEIAVLLIYLYLVGNGIWLV